MLSSLPQKVLFSSTLILGTLMSISASSWMTMWMGLELNMLSFIPLMTTTNNQETKPSMMYFITQATASMIIICTMLLSIFPKSSPLMMHTPTTMLILLSTGFLMKLGMPPCHWWLPKVTMNLSWMTTLTLLTWQKIAPMFILWTMTMNTQNFFLMTMVSIGAITGGLGGLNQTNLRPMLAYASITHMSWMLAASMTSLTISIIYLTIYILMTTTLILFITITYMDSCKDLMSWKNSNPSTTTPIALIMMSMGGMPPSLGFIPKLLVLQTLATNSMYMTILFLLTGSLLNLTFYLNILFNMLTPPHTTKKSRLTTPLILTPLLLATSTAILLTPLMT